MAQKRLSKKKKPPSMARADTTSLISVLQAEHQRELEELVLTKRPFETLKLFSLAIFHYLEQVASYVINRGASFCLLTLLGVALGILLIMLDGPHEKLVNELCIYLGFIIWWLGLGVASSIGLGSGLHTFVLYLGPHIAFFTLKATQCGRVDLKSALYDTILLNRVPSWIEKDCSEIGPPLYPPFMGSERFRTPLHKILPQVQLEAVLWGIGTALGELPPYFLSRAACLSGKKLEDLEQLNALADESGTVSVLMMRLKCWFYSKSRHLNFFTILILASVPNPLFDLAGIMCGQLSVSFWRFFTPTMIGKAIIKTHIQTLFIILVCNNQLVEWLVWILNHIPALSHTSAHFMARLHSLREKFNDNPVIPSRTSKAEQWNFSFSFMWNTLIWLMLMGFFSEIITGTAQRFLKERLQLTGCNLHFDLSFNLQLTKLQVTTMSESQTSSGNSENTESDYHSSEPHDAQEEVQSGHKGARHQNRHGVDFGAPPRELEKFAKGTFNPLNPLLIYATRLPKKNPKVGGGSRDWVCNICGHHFVGSYTRVKQHILAITGKGVNMCPSKNLDSALREQLWRLERASAGKGLFSSRHMDPGTNIPPSSASSKRTKVSTGASRSSAMGGTGTVSGMYNILDRDDTDDAIGKFLFANGIPFHVVRSPYYKEMVQAIAKIGPSYVPPGEHKLRTTILDRQVSKINVQKERMRQTWLRFGCSIVMDGWTDIRKRPLINIIVTSSEGPFFLKAVDCSGKRKDASFQFELLREAIEDVGPDSVVQVVTDATAVCRSAGLLIQNKYQHIFWTPCCVHALNNALKDIGKIQWISDLVSAARDVQMFICNHHTSLAMYRAHTRKEFLKPTDTRYASYFLLLERMIEVQAPLQSLVVSSEWGRWSESKSDTGKKVRLQVLDNDWWADCSYLVSFLGLIVEVIRYTDSDAPSLGEIYETFDSMLGRVKVAIQQREPSLEFYTSQIRPIIQRRWDRMNTPLHMAAYALNPKWYVERPGRVPPIDDPEVKKGFLDAIAKMFSEEEGSKFRRQFVQFASLSGPFNTRGARADRIDLAQDDPIGWWRMHGDDAPELKDLAMRLLSQIASSSAAERNWSTYSFIHSIKRNRLTSRRAEKLVAVHSALRLEHRKTPEYLKGPATRWDVDPEDDAQVDMEERLDERQMGLVGVPLSMFENASDSDSDGDMVDPDLFMQQLDADIAETSGALP